MPWFFILYHKCILSYNNSHNNDQFHVFQFFIGSDSVWHIMNVTQNEKSSKPKPKILGFLVYIILAVTILLEANRFSEHAVLECILKFLDVPQGILTLRHENSTQETYFAKKLTLSPFQSSDPSQIIDTKILHSNVE